MLEKFLRNSKWIYERWIKNPELNIEFDNLKRINHYRAKTFSITNFKYPKKLMYLILFFSFFPGIILSLAQGIIITGNLHNYVNNFAINISYEILNVYVPILWLIICSFLIIFWYKKPFINSGIFVFIFYFVIFKFFKTLFSGLIYSGDQLSFNILNKWINWIFVIWIFVLFLASVFLIPDIKRSFLLLFFNQKQTDKIIFKTCKRLEVNDDKYNLIKLFVLQIQIEKFFITIMILTIISFSSWGFSVFGSQISRFFPRIRFGNQASIDQSLQSPNYVLEVLPTYLTVILMAPLIEEMALRVGFMQTNNNSWSSVFWSAFIFGFMHVHKNGLFVIFPYFFFGLSQAISYKITGNYWFVFLSHLIINTFSLFSIF